MQYLTCPHCGNSWYEFNQTNKCPYCHQPLAPQTSTATTDDDYYKYYGIDFNGRGNYYYLSSWFVVTE